MTRGHVTLVGGGPGSEELLTLGAVAALAEADVVLYDRLAPHERLAELAPHAELIDVGKRPGHHPVSQTEIEQLLISHARRGARVVRLKGGDPFVFGRGGEEMQACREAGISVSVISGVSSAVAVPASEGIPLTFRDVSRIFTVVSGHAPLSDSELRHLAGLGSTIVILMGVSNLPSHTQGLVRHGMSPDTPIAVIQHGFGPRQAALFSTLATVVYDAAASGVGAPAVIVIGEVVAHAQRGHPEAHELVFSAGMTESSA